jgi:alpha-galactosidase
MGYESPVIHLRWTSRLTLFCSGVDEPWTWANKTGNSWRMSNDINRKPPLHAQIYSSATRLTINVTASWSRILQILNLNSFLSDYTDFTGHNDADMLEVGNGILTPAETRSHFALWAMMKSPLIIGTNLTALSDANIAILQNKYLLAFNQDNVYGKPAAPYKWGVNPDWTFNSTFPAQYWSGASSKGTAVALFNPFNETKTMVADYAEVPQLEKGGCYDVVDMWTGKDMGCKEKKVSVKVAPHDTAALLFTRKC